MTLAFAVLLARALASVPPRAAVSYSALRASVFAVVRRRRSVQVTLGLGATAFGVLAAQRAGRLHDRGWSRRHRRRPGARADLAGPRPSRSRSIAVVLVVVLLDVAIQTAKFSTRPGCSPSTPAP
jgi:hypothetical protein